MTSKAEFSTEFMFGVLDYETWLIRRYAEVVAQVTINTSDRTVHLQVLDKRRCQGLPPASHARLRQWWQWVRDREVLP